jgi:hypothetical protein
MKKAGPLLKRLVAGFPLWRRGFDPGSGQAGFVADRVALGLVSHANLHSIKFIIIITRGRLQ